jgi:hypothetical protein
MKDLSFDYDSLFGLFATEWALRVFQVKLKVCIIYHDAAHLKKNKLKTTLPNK